jgi:hypothetical protein
VRYVDWDFYTEYLQFVADAKVNPATTPDVRCNIGATCLAGKVYAESDGLQHLEATTALELGFCKPGSLCAADDEVLLICAAGGDCARDRTEKAMAFYFANGGAEAGWKRTLELASQVRAAAATRNVGFFVR